MDQDYPSLNQCSSKQQFLHYVQYFHHQLLSHLDKVPFDSPLAPSGWSLAEMLNHISHMERRWLQWGFLGQEGQDIWGGWLNNAPGTTWDATNCSPTSLRSDFGSNEVVLKEILEDSSLDGEASQAAKFADLDSPPQLHWILLHIIDELARHLGQLEVAAEFHHRT